MSELPLIAQKPLCLFTAEEYHAHVTAMYGVRTKGKAKPKSPAPGLSVTRTKKGALSVRRSAKQRPFAYVTYPEIEALAREAGTSQADLWQLFRAKGFIITQTRMEAEARHAEQSGKPL